MRGRGKDFVRSQGRLRATAGDGLRTGGSLRTRLAWCAAPLLCLAVIAASLLGFGAIAHGRSEGTAAHGEVSSAVEEGVQGERASSGEGSTDASARADDAGGGDAAYGQDSLLGRSGAREEEAGAGDSHVSTAASLLAELDRLSADREAGEGQVAVELLHLLDGAHQRADAFQRVILALDRHKHCIARVERVYGYKSERGRTVYEYVIIPVSRRRERHFKLCLTVFDFYQIDFRRSKVH